MADNSHALRQIRKRARMRMVPVFSVSDAINQAEMASDHHVLGFSLHELQEPEPGDYPGVRATRFDEGEREPE